MNSKFDYFIKRALLVCLGITALSGLLIISYAKSKDLTFNTIFENGFISVDYNNDWLDVDIGTISTHIGESTSQFDIINLREDDTFKAVNQIHINTAIEEVVFVTEDRDDVRVVYERELPDTESYKVRYKAELVGDKIDIKAGLKSIGLNIDRAYKGTLTLYVPEDYHLDRLKIHTDFGRQDLTIPMKVDALDLSVDFGAIDATFPTEMERLDINVDAGDLNFVAEAPIDVINATVSTGELTYDLQGGVEDLTITNDLGQIIGQHSVSPDEAHVSCDLGSIKLIFDEPLKSLNATVDIGDLDIDVSDDDDSVVFVEKDLASFKSVLDTTSQRSRANVFVEVDLGNVDIY